MGATGVQRWYRDPLSPKNCVASWVRSRSGSRHMTQVSFDSVWTFRMLGPCMLLSSALPCVDGSCIIPGPVPILAVVCRTGRFNPYSAHTGRRLCPKSVAGAGVCGGRHPVDGQPDQLGRTQW